MPPSKIDKELVARKMMELSWAQARTTLYNTKATSNVIATQKKIRFIGRTNNGESFVAQELDKTQVTYGNAGNAGYGFMDIDALSDAVAFDKRNRKKGKVVRLTATDET